MFPNYPIGNTEVDIEGLLDHQRDLDDLFGAPDLTPFYESLDEEIIESAGETYRTDSFDYDSLLDVINLLECNGFRVEDNKVTCFLSDDLMNEFENEFNESPIGVAGVDINTVPHLDTGTGVIVHTDSIANPLVTEPWRIVVAYPEGVVEIQKETNDDSTMEDDTTSYQSPDDVLRSNAELFEQKNEDYGESWRLAGETMAMWAKEMDLEEIDPTDERQMISLGLYFQRIHKLTRPFNLEFGSGDPNNEPIAESHRDESTYAGIHTSFALEGRPMPACEEKMDQTEEEDYADS